MDFDVVIASPDAMRIVGTLGQILGPHAVLMPNPKVGTMTPDVTTAVPQRKESRSVQFRVDKAGIVHAQSVVARLTQKSCKAILAALIDALIKGKPTTSKGVT
jgi:large subunit ribosomal protein L1